MSAHHQSFRTPILSNKVRGLLAAAAILLCCGFLPGGEKTAAGACDPLCELLGTLTQGEWKQLVAPGACYGQYGTPSNFSCNSLGTVDCGDPSKNSACWCNDFDANPNGPCTTGSVETTGTGWADFWYGYWGSNNAVGNATGYSAPGIRKSDGMVLQRGGGHAVSYGGEGSIHGFNVEAAAVSLLAGGKGGNWFIVSPGPRLLPNTVGEPPWSQQNDTACADKSPWVTTNTNGQQATQAPHTYWGTQPIPGTDNWFLGGVYDGCGPTGVASSHSGALEINSDTGATTLYGSFSAGSTMFPGGAYDPIDGKIYQGAYEATDGQTVHAFTITSPAAYTDNPVTRNAPCDGSAEYGRAIVFPDPSSPSADSDFIEDYWYAYNGKAGSATFLLIKHLHGVGGARSYNCSTFPANIPQYAVSGGEYAYDDDDGSFYWAVKNGGAMYHMVLDFTTFNNSTITAVPTTPSGNIPNCANPQGGTFSGVEYLPASRPNGGGRAGVILSCNGLVWIRSAPF